MKGLIISFAVALLVVTISCSNSSEPEKQFKDPRDMTWTVDTITYPNSLQVCLNSIWGSSPTDVYAVGHNESNGGQFWHYDGTSWKSIDLFQYVDRGSWTLWKVYGFDANNFWIIGNRDVGWQEIIRKSLIIQYKNGWWYEHKLDLVTTIYDITSTSPSNIWACGSNGIILHYNGYSWSADTINIKNFPPETEFNLKGITVLNDEVLITAIIYNPYLPVRGSYYIKGTMKNWKIIDSTIFNADNWDGDEKFGSSGLYKTSSNKIYSYGAGGIWKLNNNQWNAVLLDNYAIGYIFGLGDKYLFATAAFGWLRFFDGNSWIGLNNLVPNQKNINFKNGWTNGEEIFLLGNDEAKTYILHGK